MKNYFINEQTDKNEVVYKWTNIGFLDSTKEENKKKTAMAFEIMQKYYMYNDLSGDDYVKTLIFPVIGRIIRDTTKEYTFLELTNEVLNIFNKFNEFSNSFDFEVFKSKSVLQEHLDKEAVTVANFLFFLWNLSNFDIFTSDRPSP